LDLAGGSSVAATSGLVAPVRSLFASITPSARAGHGLGPSVQATRLHGQAAESKVNVNDSVRLPDRFASPAMLVHRTGDLSPRTEHRNPSSGFLADAAGSTVTVVSALEFLASRVKRRMFDRRQRRGDRRKGAPLVRRFSPVSRPRKSQAPVIGLFKTELIHRRRPWRGVEEVEFATVQSSATDSAHVVQAALA
jgi:hypothetical protein